MAVTPHTRARIKQLSLLGDESLCPQHPVAICTLTDDALREDLMKQDALQHILVGSLHTENLGIEHLMTYCLHNPHIRFIVLCGLVGKQVIGHLPGQSFMALVENGLDENGTIIGAQGKRPIIQNVTHEGVEHFRKNVEVLNHIGNQDISSILGLVQDCIARSPGIAEPFYGEPEVSIVEGSVPDRLVLDACGYFVISIDRERQLLVMEHYQNNGVLSTVIEGKTNAELYFPAIELALVSQLDHAAYLGRELARAEQALKTGEEYIQDAQF